MVLLHDRQGLLVLWEAIGRLGVSCKFKACLWKILLGHPPYLKQFGEKRGGGQ